MWEALCHATHKEAVEDPPLPSSTKSDLLSIAKLPPIAVLKIFISFELLVEHVRKTRSSGRMKKFQ